MDTNSTDTDQVYTLVTPESAEVHRAPLLITSEAEKILTAHKEETTVENTLDESENSNDPNGGDHNSSQVQGSDTNVSTGDSDGTGTLDENDEEEVYGSPSIDRPQSHQPSPGTINNDTEELLIKNLESEKKFQHPMIGENSKENGQISSSDADNDEVTASQKIFEVASDKTAIAPTAESVPIHNTDIRVSQKRNNMIITPQPLIHPHPVVYIPEDSNPSPASSPLSSSSPSTLPPSSSQLSSSSSLPASSELPSTSSSSQKSSSSFPSSSSKSTSSDLSLPSSAPTQKEMKHKRIHIIPPKTNTTATESNVTRIHLISQSTTKPPSLLNTTPSLTAADYVHVHPQVSVKSPVLAIVLPSIFGILLLCILTVILFIVYRRHKFMEKYEEKCRDIEKKIYNKQTVEINDVYSLPADNISTKSLYSQIDNHRGDSRFDESTTELLPDDSSNIYDQIQHSPPIYQNVVMPFGSVSSGHATTMVDNDMYEHAAEVLAGDSDGNAATTHLPPLLIRRPSERRQPRARINPDYDPVYVPHSDASAMERRLDRSGYVQTTRMRSNQCMHEDLPIFTQLVNGGLAYSGPARPTDTEESRSDRSLEEQVPVLDDEDMLENEETRLLHDHHHVYSSVSPALIPSEVSDHDHTQSDSETVSDGGSDSTFEGLYHDVNDDIRDQIYESVTFD